MSRNDGLDRRLTAWLDDEAAPYAPADLRMRFADGVGRTRQRPAWATTERWISMETRARARGRAPPGHHPRRPRPAGGAGRWRHRRRLGAVRPAMAASPSCTRATSTRSQPDGTDRQLLVEGSGTFGDPSWSPRRDAAGVLVGDGLHGPWQAHGGRCRRLEPRHGRLGRRRMASPAVASPPGHPTARSWPSPRERSAARRRRASARRTWPPASARRASSWPLPMPTGPPVPSRSATPIWRRGRRPGPRTVRPSPSRRRRCREGERALSSWMPMARTCDGSTRSQVPAGRSFAWTGRRTARASRPRPAWRLVGHLGLRGRRQRGDEGLGGARRSGGPRGPALPGLRPRRDPGLGGWGLSPWRARPPRGGGHADDAGRLRWPGRLVAGRPAHRDDDVDRARRSRHHRPRGCHRRDDRGRRHDVPAGNGCPDKAG